MDERQINRRHRPSIFFPVMLITAGIALLLINSGNVAPENALRLLPLWPVLLIMAGLGIILERFSWYLSALLWVATGAAIIWLLLAGPSILPALPQPEVRQYDLREPIGEAAMADVNLDLSIYPTVIDSLSDSPDLIDATVFAMNGMRFNASNINGTSNKRIILDESPDGFRVDFQWIGQLGQSMPTWEIGLTPDIPIDLTVDAGTGRTTLNLMDLQLSALHIDASTGELEVNLPAAEDELDVRFEASTGQTVIVIPTDASVNLVIDGSTGGIQIDVPETTGVEVEVVDQSTGNLRLPDGYTKVREGDDDREGVWQNAAYDTAQNKVRIAIEMSTGNVTLR
jgi:hypothetical protein